jgi:hypothetical protein
MYRQEGRQAGRQADRQTDHRQTIRNLKINLASQSLVSNRRLLVVPHSHTQTHTHTHGKKMTNLRTYHLWSHLPALRLGSCALLMRTMTNTHTHTHAICPAWSYS